jgi:IS30 family transposase
MNLLNSKSIKVNNNMAEQQKEWLTVEQIAKDLNVHPETI